MSGTTRKSSTSFLITFPVSDAFLTISFPCDISNLLLRLSGNCVVVVINSEREGDEKDAEIEEEEEEDVTEAMTGMERVEEVTEEEEDDEEEDEEEGVGTPSSASNESEGSCARSGIKVTQSKCPVGDRGVGSKVCESHSSGTTHASRRIRMFCRRLSKAGKAFSFCIFQSS